MAAKMALAAEAAPGVYVRGQEAIEAPVVDTAVAGFVGISERGPIGVPQPLRSFGEYLQVFGGFVPHGHLAECAYAFFQNGGEKCWVVRAADEVAPGQAGPCPPVESLSRAGFAPLPDANGADALAIAALDEGKWGNEIAFAIDAESARDMSLTTVRAPVAASDTIVNVESVLDLTNTSTVRLVSAANPFVQLITPVAAVDLVNRQITLPNPAGAVFPSGSTVSGRGFRITIRFRDDIEVFDELSMTPEHPRYAPHIVNAETDVTGYIERRRLGHSILVRIDHLRPGGILSGKPAGTPALDGSGGTGPHRMSGGGDGFRSAFADFPEAAGPGVIRLYAKRDLGTSAHDIRVAIEPFRTRTALGVPIVPGGTRDQVVVEDADTLFAGDDLTLTFTAPDGTLTTATRQVQTMIGPNTVAVAPDFPTDFPVGSDATVQNRFDVRVERGEDREPVERHRNLSGVPAHPRAYHVVLQSGSRLLCTLAPTATLVPGPASKLLAGGIDPGTIDYRFYTGYQPDQSLYTDVRPDGTPLTGPVGLAALERLTEVCLVAIPDLHRVATADFVRAQGQILAHCDQAGSCFGLLDPPPPLERLTPQDVELSLQRIESWPLNFRNGPSAKNGALYFPWVTGSFEGALKSVTPSGFVAGHIGDSDRRRGVGKAPANARLVGVVDLDLAVDRETQARLNPHGVNCIRKFEDGQVRLLGARTLSGDPRWSFVNVRRVLLSVVKTLSHNMLWAAFEPNDRVLQRRIESTLTSYLSSLVAKGVTAGAGAGDSFYVKCNEETNPPEEREAGRVVAEIGLAISAPAEFIVLTVRKTPDALSIIEEDV